MVDKFETELKDHLKTIGEVRSYLGEFDNPKELEACVKGEPIVFIDFDGDEYIDTYSKECRWNLYIVGTTSSKHETYREKSRHEIIAFMEAIDKSLIDRSFTNSSPIKLIASKKIFDGITDHGYLSVYVRNFKAVLYEETIDLIDEEEF
ncbi:hypothetical protein [Halarcobacter anaerophilus]|jgi:hypothetical protein|uniref:hypothetical protein n=1 Tax=Halarcobacter anaerophilus TaxID=877500 RepID=UPI0005CB4873|nr:hypothetical protein [Halarcobacter anaerophilus]